LVDGTAENPAENWKVIRAELKAYDPDLAKRREITAISKADACDTEQLDEIKTALIAAGAKDVVVLSSVSGFGVTETLRLLLQEIDDNRQEEEIANQDPIPWQP